MSALTSLDYWRSEATHLRPESLADDFAKCTPKRISSLPNFNETIISVTFKASLLSVEISVDSIVSSRSSANKNRSRVASCERLSSAYSVVRPVDLYLIYQALKTASMQFHYHHLLMKFFVFVLSNSSPYIIYNFF